MGATVSNVPQDRDEELREQILTNKRRTGGDPSLLLDLLHELVERESWKRRGKDGWTFLRYVQTPFDEGGLGFDREEVENIIQFRHKYEKDGPRHDPEKVEEMEELRATVRDLLTPELGEHGTNQYETDSGDSYNNLQGRGAEYLAARIKRDHPDVHERMKEGEFRSVRQAAIEAGIIEDIRTKQIRETDGPEKMEAKIRHVYGDEVANRLFSGGADSEEDGRSTKEDTTPTRITERDDAPSKAELAGPPQTKDPDSEEYAWQKAGLLQLYAESIRDSLQEWERVTEEARREAIHETLGYDTFPEMLDDVVGARPAQRAVQRAHPDTLFDLEVGLTGQQLQALLEGAMLHAGPEVVAGALGRLFPDDIQDIEEEALFERYRMRKKLEDARQ